MSDVLFLVQSLIHDIRGIKVMLDYDLAKLYQIETKALKQAVRRNRERFPEILCLNYHRMSITR